MCSLARFYFHSERADERKVGAAEIMARSNLELLRDFASGNKRTAEIAIVEEQQNFP